MASIRDPCYDAGLVAEFLHWPGGGGNLNYPRVYNDGLASMIKEVEERQTALEMRLPNASKLYFYEACLIIMRAIIRLAHRYAELARDMAAKEKNADPQGGVDRHCRDLRMGSRASGPEPERSHPVPLPLPHLRGDRAGRLRLLRGLSGPEPRAVLSARQGGRADRSGRRDVHAQEPLHQAERDRLLLWREGRHAELCRPGSEHHPRGLSPRMGKMPPRKWTT